MVLTCVHTRIGAHRYGCVNRMIKNICIHKYIDMYYCMPLSFSSYCSHEKQSYWNFDQPVIGSVHMEIIDKQMKLYSCTSFFILNASEINKSSWARSINDFLRFLEYLTICKKFMHKQSMGKNFSVKRCNESNFSIVQLWQLYFTCTWIAFTTHRHIITYIANIQNSKLPLHL